MDGFREATRGSQIITHREEHGDLPRFGPLGSVKPYSGMSEYMVVAMGGSVTTEVVPAYRFGGRKEEEEERTLPGKD